MIKKLWNKLTSALTFNVQQPIVFKMYLIAALVCAATLPAGIEVVTTTGEWWYPATAALVLFNSTNYLLESIAFRPDRYVNAEAYNRVKYILNMAQLHREAMVGEVKKMKKSKSKDKLADILGIKDQL